MQYTDPALTSSAHIQLLQSMQLTFTDKIKAQNYIELIGYHRLSAYFTPFLLANNTFKSSINFDHIMELYKFDRKLRLICADVMERIEIAIRSAISNTMSLHEGPHWFMDARLFDNATYHREFIKKIEQYTNKSNSKNQTPECKKYFSTYTMPVLPPSWVITEILPMGVWSKTYANIKNKQYKRSIANIFVFKHTEFESWIRSLTIIRNMIAHHARFWNAHISVNAKNIPKYSYHGVPLHSSYINYVIIHAFAKRFMQRSKWAQRFIDHIQHCPLCIHTHMKFPQNWDTHQFWTT